MRQSGFLSLPIAGYAAVAGLVLFAGMSVAIKVQSSRLEACKQEFATFKAEIQVAAAAADLAARQQEAKDLKNKEKSDAELVKIRSANAALNRRLRDSAGSSVLPIPGPAAVRPDAACFDRAQLDSALRRFTQGTAEIAIDGAAAVADLDNAREWARSR